MTKTGATSNLTLPPASGWLRTMIKALLKRYTYPPDKESAVIELVLQQMGVIFEEWARQELGDQI